MYILKSKGNIPETFHVPVGRSVSGFDPSKYIHGPISQAQQQTYVNNTWICNIHCDFFAYTIVI